MGRFHWGTALERFLERNRLEPMERFQNRSVGWSFFKRKYYHNKITCKFFWYCKVTVTRISLLFSMNLMNLNNFFFEFKSTNLNNFFFEFKSMNLNNFFFEFKLMNLNNFFLDLNLNSYFWHLNLLFFYLNILYYFYYYIYYTIL